MFPWMLDDFVLQDCYELKRLFIMAAPSITMNLLGSIGDF